MLPATTIVGNAEKTTARLAGKGIQVVRDRFSAGDPSVESSWYTVISFPSKTGFHYFHDSRLTSEGAVYHGLLIDQAKTEEKFGSPAGILPQDFFQDYGGTTICFPFSHMGWQYGSFVYRNGELLCAPDDPMLNRTVRGIAYFDDQGWVPYELVLRDGQLATKPTPRVSLNGAPLLWNHEAVDSRELFGSDRILADWRNVFNFGVGTDPEIYTLVRYFSQYLTADHGIALLDRSKQVDITIPLGEIPEIVISRTKQLIQDNRSMRLLETANSLTWSLQNIPLNRIPMTVLATDSTGQLSVLIFEGRLMDSPGLTLNEVTDFCLNKRWKTAHLLCAGGDSCIYLNEQAGVTLLSRPSGGEIRRTPDILGFII